MSRLKRFLAILSIAGVIGGSAGVASVVLEPAPDASADIAVYVWCYGSYPYGVGFIRIQEYPIYRYSGPRPMTWAEYGRYCWRT